MKTLAIENRKQAIKAAVGYAAPGDIILIAGKGHEAQQIYKNKIISISDKNLAVAIYFFFVHTLSQYIFHILV